MTTVFYAKEALLNPSEDTPFVGNPSSRLLVRFDAESLFNDGLADGFSVENWIGVGVAQEEFRTLNAKVHSSKPFPVLRHPTEEIPFPRVDFFGGSGIQAPANAGADYSLSDFTAEIVFTVNGPVRPNALNPVILGDAVNQGISASDSTGAPFFTQSHLNQFWPQRKNSLVTWDQPTYFLADQPNKIYKFIVYGNKQRLYVMDENFVVYSTTYSKAINPIGSALVGGIRLGGRNIADTVSDFDGAIVETAVYDRFFPTSVVRKMMGSLNSKYQ